ncbi:hypothetical protein A3K86_13895 [Photobacterium jeanii]|uniref:Chromosome partitioning protein ParA n=1 Tax=Photobacterium jeanii TaxID=858640 RepID=A0A178KAJ3_9GAMM|nr:hypothetical protein [Photobacterium jeanii]OAN13663.1 hypothetical protein A3K86_13895 [Photobacterium jeanii]PST88784.1 chromosome partitioning protein ParA [Photobacterium jeanii]
MLDLTEALKSTQTSEESLGLCSVLFYQSEHCRDLVKEVFSFDALGEPILRQMKVAAWNEYFAANQLRVDMVLIELTDCEDVVARMAELAPQIPNTASVIVIGKEDAISTIRSLKEMGFYYVFWPVVKSELSDFMRHVVRNHHGGKGLGKERKAKRIAVLGSKGGVGASLLSCELARFLRKETQSRVMLVDHNYTDSNLDVMLGLDDFPKVDMSKSSVQLTQLDEDSAQALLLKVGDDLSLLAVDGEKTAVADCFKESDAVTSLLLRRFNLIVEDFSASVPFPIDYKAFCESYDTIVVVADPTVSSVRSAKRMLHNLDLAAKMSLKTPRSLLVLNQHRTFRDGVLYKNEIEKELARAVDVEIAYERSIPATLLSGKRFIEIKGKFSSKLLTLSGLVLGRSIEVKSNPLQSLLAQLTTKLKK